MSQQRKIVWAKNEQVVALRPYVDQVLEAIAQDQPHALNAMVTDRSSIGDFYIVDMEHTGASISEEEYRRQILMLQHRLGMGLQGSDLIVDVAKRISEREVSGQ